MFSFLRSIKTLLFSFLIIIMLFLYIGYNFYSRAKSNELNVQSANMESIGELKANFIDNLYNERYSDGLFLFNNLPLNEHLLNLTASYSLADSILLASYLSSMFKSHNYSNLLILDNSNQILLSLNPKSPAVFNSNSLNSSRANNKLLFSSIYKDSLDSSLHLDIYIPIISGKNIISTVILKIDPRISIYPLLSFLDKENSSIESVIISHSADGGVLFLSPLKFSPLGGSADMSPLLNSLLYGNDKSVADIVMNKDYRGEEVLADVRKIKNFPWFLVTKIDTHEIYAPVTNYFAAYIIILGLVVFISGLGFLYYHTKLNLNNLKKINETERRLNVILDNSTNLFYSHTPDHQITFVSSQSYSILGYRPEELRINWKTIVTDNPVNLIGFELTNKAILTGNVQPSYELELIKKDGSFIWVEVHEAPVVKDGATIEIVGSLTDITKRKKAEQALHENKEIFSKFMENSPVYVFFKDENLRPIMLSRNYEEMLGKPLDETLGKTADELFPSELAESMIEDDKRIMSEQKTVIVDEELNGRYYTTIKFPININGRPRYLAGYTIDITDRKLVEEALRDSEERYRLIQENSIDAMLLTAPDGSIITANRSACEMFLMTEDELCRGGRNAVVDLSDPRLNNMLEERSRSGKAKGELILKRKDGTKFPAEISTSIFVNAKGEHRTSMIISDITDRKIAEEQLLNAKEKMQLIIEGTPHLFFYIQDVKANITYISPSIVNITGHSIDDWIGKSHWFATDSPLNQDAKRRTQQNLKGIINNTPNLVEIKHADGSLILLEVYERPIFENDQVVGLQGVAHDITKRMLAENALRKSEQKYRHLFENILDGVYKSTPEGKFIEVNPALAKMLGYDSTSELLSIDIKSQLYFDLSDRESEGLNEVSKEMAVFRLKKKDGSEIWVEDHGLHTRDEKGNVIYYEGILRDVTERKQYEERIITLGRALEQSPISVVITDPDGNIEYVNRKFTQLTLYSIDEVLGKNPRLLKSGNQSEDDYKMLWDTIIAGKEWRAELQNKKKNGDLYWVDAVISPIVNKEGEIIHFISLEEDITEKKKMIEELIISKEKAEVSNRLKSNFLANMSHELRTPMIGIFGYTEILKDELKNPDHLNMMDSIFSSSKRLMETLNSILDLSRIESEKYEVNYTEFSLNAFLRDQINIFRPAAALKNITLDLYPLAENIFIQTDSNILHNILTNLINNALRFTHTGSITINCSCKQNFSSQIISISIADTGIGISPENCSIIFEEFRQASEGLDRSFEGTGLGLAIVKRLVALINGSISVESEVGVGSTFTVTFPMEFQNIAAHASKVRRL